MQNQNAKYVLKFETGAGTHVGKVRNVNEDALAACPEFGVWAVADGLGGYEAGDIASRIVVDAVESIGPSVSADDQLVRFQDRMMRSNDDIRRVAEDRGGAFMGATVAGLLIFDRQYACVWSGDSRIYRVRNGKIEQLSHDHSEVQELIDRGVLTEEEGRDWPRRNVITRAVGVFEDPGLEIAKGDIESGDIYVLCSDGLTGHVENDEIRETVENSRAQAACDTLIETTLARGAKDNVTIIVIRCHRAEKTNFYPASNTPNLEPSS